jgi:hypothetical protein
MLSILAVFDTNHSNAVYKIPAIWMFRIALCANVDRPPA